MRKIICLILGFLGGISLFAQEVNNEEVLDFVEVKPRFPGCENLEGLKEKEACSTKSMLSFIYQYIQYPDSARLNNISGTVAIRFIVSKEGRIRNPEVLKDIGGGCGAEALRVVELMSKMAESWIPAQHKGEAVSSYFSLPIKFKLEDAKPPPEYYTIGKDTIWIVTDTPVSFNEEKAGQSIDDYIQQSLYYPEEGLEECVIGEVEVEILVSETGDLGILNLADYSGLGIDYLYEVVAWVGRSVGKWKPAIKNGKPVISSIWQRLVFAPGGETCAGRISEYEQAKVLMHEGVQLVSDTSKIDEGFAKWDQAIEMFPNNSEMLAVRGQAHMQRGNIEKACEDIKKAAGIMWSDWLNSLSALLCQQ